MVVDAVKTAKSHIPGFLATTAVCAAIWPPELRLGALVSLLLAGLFYYYAIWKVFVWIKTAGQRFRSPPVP